MANTYTVFNEGLQKLNDGTYTWTSANVRGLLAQSSSPAYVPNKDHTTIQEMKNNNLVEMDASGTGYHREAVGSRTITKNTTTDKIEYRCVSSVNFGNIASGYTIVGVLFYIRVGANDDDTVDIPLIYVSLDPPQVTGGGAFVVNIQDGILFTEFQP